MFIYRNEWKDSSPSEVEFKEDLDWKETEESRHSWNFAGLVGLLVRVAAKFSAELTTYDP